MSYSWITPKTDWTKETVFSYTDYNRIRNNLLYLNEKINELYPSKAKILDLGTAKTGYNNRYEVKYFNAFEDALDSFAERTGQNLNSGVRKYYTGNGYFIDYDELNRIERCCYAWKNMKIGVESISINNEDIVIWTKTIYAAETVQLSTTILPSNAYNKSVIWQSSDTSVATVSPTGLVTRVGKGNATITVTTVDGNKTDSIDIAVYYGIASATISDSSWEASSVGETKKLSVAITPAYATGYSLTWSSSDNSVATVTDSGLVTMVGRGEVTITATIVEPHFSDNTITLTCNVFIQTGSYFVYENNNYPCDLIYLGNNLDGTGISTVIFRYCTTQLRCQWYTFEDARQPYRTTIQQFINKNFSSDMQGALQSATKTVIADAKAKTTTRLTAKYFLPTKYEINLDSSSPEYPYRPVADVRYTYFDSNVKRAGSSEEHLGAYSPVSRSVGIYSGTHGNEDILMGMVGGGVNVPCTWDSCRPLFFLSNSLHVNDTANDDGSYDIDWTNTSSKVITDLAIGTIIRDTTGAGRAG